MGEAMTKDDLVGNRWVLIGAIVYLLEWVAIVWGSVAGADMLVTRGTGAGDLEATYAGHADVVASMAGWFAVVLLGRVLIFIGLRHAFAESGYRHPLLDLAVVAAAASVVLEIASYGLAAAAADRAEAGEQGQAALIDQAGSGLNLMIAGGLGVAVAATSWCMRQSRLFSLPLAVLGLVAGVVIIGAQLSVAPGLESLFNVFFALILLFWVWMVWAGVVCWRRTPRGSRAAAPA
jgi:prepilin signal peptidase PulO-like enzyme (type II secretory pathway)